MIPSEWIVCTSSYFVRKSLVTWNSSHVETMYNPYTVCTKSYRIITPCFSLTETCNITLYTHLTVRCFVYFLQFIQRQSVRYIHYMPNIWIWLRFKRTKVAYYTKLRYITQTHIHLFCLASRLMKKLHANIFYIQCSWNFTLWNVIIKSEHNIVRRRRNIFMYI